jgi:small subunit ribosomal protein S7
MPRKSTVIKKRMSIDPKYGDKTIGKFINTLMYDGKKSKAEKVFYDAFDIIAKRTNKDPLEVFNAAMEKVKPAIEVRSRRVGGATYQVPVEVNQFRRQALAIKWIINAARGGRGKSMEEKLAAEIIEASEDRGGAVKKREDTHKMAEANRAFAHYRW